MLRDLRTIAKSAYRRMWVLPRLHKTYGSLSVRETFQNIYRNQAWGDDGTRFCSGDGSRGAVVEQYTDFVVRFISQLGVRSVVDLGCGDFVVGRAIVEAGNVAYTGIDVVPELIEHHQTTVRDARVQFKCADISSDPLPDADLCLVRQVLQHLSNKEIKGVLANLRHYPLVLISEHCSAPC